LQPNGPSYRVYTPTELQSIAPATFRSAPPPRQRGWFGFGFVMLVGVVISGASFAALQAFNVDLTSGRTSLAGPSADAPAAPVVASSAPAADPVATAPASVPASPADTAGAPASKTRRKAHRIRQSAPPILNLPRGPVVQRGSAVAGSVPPNPF
jgi:hypothetical protein